MAAMADIFAGLLARVSTLSVGGSPALPIAYPEHSDDGQPFDPETDAPDGRYLDVRIFPNRPRAQGLSSMRLDQGLLQVEVVWKKNKGVIAPAAVADEIIAHFPNGLSMGPAKVNGQPYASAALSANAEFRMPITIPWTA